MKPAKAITVLVVDDEESIRTLLRIALQRYGYTVHTASNGTAALALFAHSPVDLVLLDILMPEMDGYTLCSQLRQRSDVPIIMLSALNRPDEIVYGFSLGADDFISKPLRFGDVELRIQAILRRMAWMRERAEPVRV